jgi:NAD(P)-dependent dehydrogenase (short-subunit alcohol dehydrogenase family)
VLFNNAGVSVLGTAVELSGADWERIWNTNVSSLFYGAKYAVPVMAERGGSIVATVDLGPRRGWWPVDMRLRRPRSSALTAPPSTTPGTASAPTASVRA